MPRHTGQARARAAKLDGVLRSAISGLAPSELDWFGSKLGNDGDLSLDLGRYEPNKFNGLDRLRSGLTHRTRNAAYGQPYRGFESLPVRHLSPERDMLSGDCPGPPATVSGDNKTEMFLHRREIAVIV